jgi:hypothetical protein
MTSAEESPVEPGEEREQEGRSEDTKREDASPRRAPERNRRRRMTTFVAIAGAVAAIGAAAYAIHARNQPETLPPAPAHADALDAVPDQSMLVVTVDLRALRASPLGGALAGPGARALLGDVKATCGFEPFDSLDQLALAAPATGSDGDFGIVGSGPIDQPAMLECATKVIAARGGKPIATAVGSFKSVRDVSERASGTTGEIAVRAGGPLLIGSGDFMRAMIDTADGALPTVKTNAAHAALREAVADGSAAELSIVLSPAQRATIAEEVDSSGGKAPAGLKGVLAAALGAKVTSETVQLHGVILVADDRQAKELAGALDDVRKQRSENPLLRRLGLGSLLERVRVNADGKEVHVRLEATIFEVQQFLEKLSPPAPEPSSTPDEAPPDVAPSSPGSAASAAPSSPPPLPSAHEAGDPR